MNKYWVHRKNFGASRKNSVNFCGFLIKSIINCGFLSVFIGDKKVKVLHTGKYTSK